ncbi:NTP transferase domain-containing protein [Lysinibacillus sp. SGAir0095]|uniref:nucleotidyltransferase family protein n=1 Tax=Lysinibacillus sp. SGAir0095 TaxID=2070463 RepID=UPI0010CCE07B|nr:nucleotidyltransferase family protein [Lysinibacillus sp. SGAir0095]QCR32360.1 nucleotidyltransferase family protein [Lysinibacillus sp. SGAir0095]
MCKIGAIILAAGQSARMGKPKLFLPYLNAPLIHYPVSVAVSQKFKPIIVVGGKYFQQLQLELSEFSNQIAIVHNPEYERGMSSSLKAGINAIDAEVDGVFIFLGDQPFVSNDVVQNLIHVYRQNKKKGIKIIRPRYATQHGHPILFDKSLFHEFQSLKGDEGGKSIIKANEDKLIVVDFENTRLNLDIDTPQEYESLFQS